MRSCGGDWNWRASRSPSLKTDEIAACAWLDPSIITRRREVYMDVDLSRGPGYGDTLTWLDKIKPATGVRLVHAQVDLDLEKFSRQFIALMSGPAVGAVKRR